MSEAVSGLERRESWIRARAPDGRELADVIESRCGRYTIVETRHFDRVVYLAWRRWTTVFDGHRRMPVLLGSFNSADAARAACASHDQEVGG